MRRRDCDQEGARRYEALAATVDGLAVTHLQTALRTLGQDVPIDGCFGGATQDALLEMLGQPDFDQARGDTEKLRDAIWAKAVPLVRQAETDSGADTHAQDGKAGRSGEMPAPVGNGYPPHFCQADPRWAERVLGQKKTMRKAGCAVTCCAMLVKHYVPNDIIMPACPDGAPEDERFFLDVFLDQNGGYQGDSLVWGKVCDFAAQHGVQLDYKRETGLLDDQRAALDRACDLIEQGIFPLLRVRYAKDHWNAPF